MEALKEADWDSVIWIDDALGRDAQEWVDVYNQPVLLTKPAPAEGPTAADVAALEVFIGSNFRD